MSRAVPGVLRGCGRRQEGGLYAECGLTPGGRPLEAFLADPPVPFFVDHKIGVELVRGPDGHLHVLDWVGESHYPFVTDLLEEGLRYGFSRRLPKTLDLSRLDPSSRLLLVHAKGLVTNPRELRPHADPAYDMPTAAGRRKAAHEHHCGLLARTGNPGHYLGPAQGCTRDLWMVPPATLVRALHPETRALREVADDGLRPGEQSCYLRRHASSTYRVYPLSPEAPPPRYTPALVASLPITHITVVKARDGSHAPTLARARKLLAWEGGYRLPVAESDA